jgi:hypothetical protein
MVVTALVVVVAVLALLVVGLLRSHAEILRRLHAIDGGSEQRVEFPSPSPSLRSPSPAPRAADARIPPTDIAGAGLVDDVVLVAVAGVEHRTLLTCLSSTCGTCGAFWSALRDGEAATLPDDVRLVVVTREEPVDDRSELARLAPPDADLVLSDAAWTQYSVPGSPYFVLVDPVDGVVGEGTGLNFDQVRRLLAQSTNDARFLPAHGTRAQRSLHARPRPADRGRDDGARIDAELRAAGLQPGDAALYRPADPRRKGG